MKTNSYKYILSWHREFWLNGDYEWDFLSGEEDIFEFIEDNLLQARKNAFDEVEKIRKYFKQEEQQTEAPTFSWTEFKNLEEEPDKFKIYEVTVSLVTGDTEYCIYTTGNESIYEGEEEGEALRNLLEEYKILQQLKVDTRKIEETVTYKAKGAKKQDKIIPNGMNLNNVEIVDIINDAKDLWLNDDNRKRRIQKTLKNRVIKNRKYKSSFKSSVETKNSSIELSIKSTLETIKPSIQKEINILLEKLQSQFSLASNGRTKKARKKSGKLKSR